MVRTPGIGHLDNDGFTQVTHRKPRRVIAGKRVMAHDDTCKVKGVARRVAVFVGRMQKNTTEDDLKSFLSTAVVGDCYCRKLPDKSK